MVAALGKLRGAGYMLAILSNGDRDMLKAAGPHIGFTREVRERRLTVLPHDHGAHGRIVGATEGAEWPSSCTAVRSSG